MVGLLSISPSESVPESPPQYLWYIPLQSRSNISPAIFRTNQESFGNVEKIGLISLKWLGNGVVNLQQDKVISPTSTVLITPYQLKINIYHVPLTNPILLKWLCLWSYLFSSGLALTSHSFPLYWPDFVKSVLRQLAHMTQLDKSRGRVL